MITGVMGIPDEAFWENVGAHRASAIERAEAMDFVGHALDAPRTVDLSLRDTLPVVLLRRVPASVCAAHDLTRDALLVAVERTTSEVFVGRAFEPKYLPPSPTPRRPPPPSVTVADAFVFELRERIPTFPWAPGSYVLYLLVDDVATEGVRVRLTVPRGPSLRAAPLLDAPWPPPGTRPLPRYTPTGASPAIPVSPGVSLRCDPVVILQPQVWCVLEGAFHLRVVSDNEQDERDTAWSDDEHTTRRTMIDVGLATQESQVFTPLTLVLTGPGLDPPWHRTLTLPATLQGDAMTGHFALDLFAFPEFPRGPGNYYLWAFAGDVVAGPEPLALVTEDRLAPP
jgi:hypothetical protein